jgi:hypothetical protein
VGQTIGFSTSAGDKAVLNDVVFGDVYICSGQSNMQFSVGGTKNASQEAANANNYPHIRVFTVGQGTSSKTPLNDLATIEQVWAVATNKSVDNGGAFDFFSSVCYFFGKGISDDLGKEVPLGLISNNWGGTPVEHWADAAAFQRCNRTDTDSTLYNAMIHPYEVGPMALTLVWRATPAAKSQRAPKTAPLTPNPWTLRKPVPHTVGSRGTKAVRFAFAPLAASHARTISAHWHLTAPHTLPPSPPQRRTRAAQLPRTTMRASSHP